jgi:N-acetylglucosamine kinase-like BadF-type ATPase
MRYYLGIDQGGTKTAALLCDENGRIWGSAKEKGLTTTYFSDTGEAYLKNISSAAGSALSMAGISQSAVSAVCGCLNGADWDFEYPILERNLVRATSCTDIIVINDCIGAMRGGTASRECAVVCAGTGLNAAVRCGDGREIIYGYFVDSADQGANALGQATLRKVMDSYLGLCGDTLLSKLVMDHTGYETAEQLLIDLTMKRCELQVKELVGCLLDAYRKGDSEAALIVDEFARSVSRYIVAGLKRFDMLSRPVEVVFSGGVLKDNGTLLSKAMIDYMKQSVPDIIGVNARYEPICGAVLTLLDRHYGMRIPPEVLEEFDRSAVRLGLIRNTLLKPLG